MAAQGDGSTKYTGELDCLSLSLPAHPGSRGSRLVNNLIFLLQLKYKDSKPPSSQTGRGCGGAERGGGHGREKEAAVVEGRNQKGLTQTFLPRFNLSPSTISIILQPEIQEDILSQHPAPPPGSCQSFSHPLSSPPPPSAAQQLPIVGG